MDDETNEMCSGVALGSKELLLEFKALDEEKIREACDQYSKLKGTLDKQWEEEAAKYEELMEVSVNGKVMLVPRRNYYNRSGIVTDPSLFPYCNALYPLIDAYDCLYEDENDHPIEKDSVRPTQVTLSEREHDENTNHTGLLPSSVEAITECLVGPGMYARAPENRYLPCVQALLQKHKSRCADLGKLCSDTQYFDEYFWTKLLHADIEAAKVSLEKCRFRKSIRPPSFPEQYSPAQLPADRSSRSDLMLKILRHSMSDLQRDHVLALAALIRLVIHHDLDDVIIFRRVLATIDSELILCNGMCDVPPDDHKCWDWEVFLQFGVAAGLCDGPLFLTEAHAMALIASIRSLFRREFSSLIVELDDADHVAEKQKAWLKQSLVAMREFDRDYDIEDTVDRSIPVVYLKTIVDAIGRRAHRERCKLLKELREPTLSDDLLARVLDSYFNTIRTLVNIGEVSTYILPAGNRLAPLMGRLVANLSIPFIDFENPRLPALVSEPPVPARRNVSAVDPLRYGKYVATATSLYAEQRKYQAVTGGGSRDLLHFVERACGLYPPPPEVIRVVRALFIRNLPDLEESGMGYGDFVSWCHCEIHPLDPVLFLKDCVYPIDDESSDEESTDSERSARRWDADEDGHALKTAELRARNDFSILCLLAAWNASWTPESHRSFQRDFRKAVQTIAMCIHRLRMPNELTRKIAEYLSRDWWLDERAECFNPECLEENVMRQLEQKFRPETDKNAKREVCRVCPRCRVHRYCSKSCLERDRKTGHGRYCTLPPTKVPGTEDYRVIFEVIDKLGLGDHHPFVALISDKRLPAESDVAEIVEDDDEDWESLPSSDESSSGAERRSEVTRTIVDYFEEHTYRFAEAED